MEGLGSIMQRYKEDRAKVKPPSHAKAAAVNEIIKVLGENKTYSYAYWLRKVGNASYSDVLGILKEASNLESKYSKGGFITNQLKPYAVSKPKSSGPRTNRRGVKRTEGPGKGLDGKVVRKVDDSKGRVEPKSVGKSSD